MKKINILFKYSIKAVNRPCCTQPTYKYSWTPACNAFAVQHSVFSNFNVHVMIHNWSHWPETTVLDCMSLLLVIMITITIWKNGCLVSCAKKPYLLFLMHLILLDWTLLLLKSISAALQAYNFYVCFSRYAIKCIIMCSIRGFSKISSWSLLWTTIVVHDKACIVHLYNLCIK